MGLFSFLNNNKVQQEEQLLPIKVNEESQNYDIPERVFIENNPIANNANEKIEDQAPTDNNINLLFNFMDRNHEARGYDDALMNPDSSHLDQNLEALKNELERTIEKVKTFYEDFIQEIDYHIKSRSRSGMIDIVEELEMKKLIAQNHLRKLLEIEESTRNNTGNCRGILISYTRGFKNGLAAISHHTILKKRF